MQGYGFVIVAVGIGLLAGCLLATQPSVNGQLARHLVHPLQATVVSFTSGTLIILLLTLMVGHFPPKFTTPPTQLPWWIWFGGAIGVVMVTTSLILVPRVGSLVWFAAIMTGQTLTALLLDHYGLLGNPKAPLSMTRLLAAVFLIAGVLLVVQAKRVEQRELIERASSQQTRREATVANRTAAGTEPTTGTELPGEAD